MALQLNSPADDFDLGVRVKGDLLQYLHHSAPQYRGTDATQRLNGAAQAVAHVVALSSGDLVLMDNDRWGHGR